MARNLRLPDHIRNALRSCSFNLPASSQIDALAATESDDLHQDFFYVCPGHLKDRAFCNPVDDGAQQAANQRAEEMALEVEAVKREYAEKLKKRKDAKAEKAPEDDDKQAQQEKKDKVSSAGFVVSSRGLTLYSFLAISIGFLHVLSVK